MIAQNLAKENRAVLISHLHKLIADLKTAEETQREPSTDIIRLRERIKIIYQVVDGSL